MAVQQGVCREEEREGVGFQLAYTFTGSERQTQQVCRKRTTGAPCHGMAQVSFVAGRER